MTIINKEPKIINMAIGEWARGFFSFKWHDDKKHADINGIYSKFAGSRLEKGDKIWFQGHQWNIDDIKYTGNSEDLFDAVIFCERKL